MLQAATLQFLRELRLNNHKAWFEANRSRYEAAKADFLVLTGQLITAIAKFDPPIGQLQPKNCTFRINRDVRFSKDKQPYKNNMAAYFSAGGKKAELPGYYLHCEPGKSFIAGGFYSPSPGMLAALRQEIDYNYDAWTKILSAKKFKALFPNGLGREDALVRPPRGYEEDNPAIHYLKLKHFVVSAPVDDAVLQQKNAAGECAGRFAVMKPMIDFLQEAVAQ